MFKKGRFVQRAPILSRKQIAETQNATQESNQIDNTISSPAVSSETFYNEKIEARDARFIESTQMKSWIWKWLLISESGRKAKCKICGTILSRVSGSTTILGRHLTKFHLNILQSKGAIPFSHHANLENALMNSCNITANNSCLSSNDSFQSFHDMNETPSPIKRKTIETNDETINEFHYSKRVKTKPRSSIPNIYHFKETLNNLNEFYEDTTRKLVEDNNLISLSETLRAEIQKVLNDESTDTICLSAEHWTSKQNESYLGLTVHFIDDNFNEIHHSFGLKNRRPTTNNIKELMNEWNIQNKVKYFVSSVKPHLEDVQNLPCACHAINLCVKDALTPLDIDDNDELDYETNSNEIMSALIIKCKNFAGVFARITGQEIDLSSHWTSLYSVISSIVENKDSLDTIIADNTNLTDLNDYYPTEEEFVYINDYLKLFESLKRISIELMDKNYINCSILFPSIYHLIASLDEIKLVTVELDEIRFRFKTALKTRFSYMIEDNADLFLSLAFLDYRFKFFKFINDQSLREVYHKRVKNYLQSINKIETVKMNEFENELQEYLEYQPKSYIEKPLEFYRNNFERFPILSNMARGLFSITASAIPSERLFTNTGQLINDARNRLDSTKIEMVTFVKDNFDLS